VVKFGMYVDMRNPPQWERPWALHYGHWLERIVEAERLGADAVWLTEHHFFEDGYLPQCWTLAAAIAARTTSVRIGTAVALLPLHSSIETAEQVAMVDILSDGRVEPGFGVGYRIPEYEGFGGDFLHRYQVYERRIHEIRQLWGEEPGSLPRVTPAPLQRPLPIWGGFNAPYGARLAGRLGLRLQSLHRHLYEPYRKGLREGGHDPATARMMGLVEFLLADDPERAWATVRPHAVYRWNSYDRYKFQGTGEETPSPDTGEDWIDSGRFIIGTPERIAEVFKSRVEGLPVSDVFGWSDFPGMPDDLIDRHLELMFTKLAPLLR
jgi:alkanesulfonate monooxygenase SsuD/methylene tetrahydromethanopterin reductase-like flavin-dependent oxidoreductase (luciferase family)